MGVNKKDAMPVVRVLLDHGHQEIRLPEARAA
jgi:hypothetical protein